MFNEYMNCCSIMLLSLCRPVCPTGEIDVQLHDYALMHAVPNKYF